MKFVSTRGAGAGGLSFSETLYAGLAPDGGLYVPESFPQLYRKTQPPIGFADTENTVLHAFLEGDPLQKHLESICRDAFNFPVPLEFLDANTAVLELFHGPTAAFKDVGARFLAACVALKKGKKQKLVVVATSGDTGGAVAAAFHDKPGVNVAILFPLGQVSQRQQLQLTTWGGNVRAFAVRGTFDDCQRVVKQALQNAAWRKEHELVSANSINIGRILPQAGYYAMAGQSYFERTGNVPGFIVPSGNLGNVVGALWAKQMGFPIGPVVMACNANRVVCDFFESGRWEPKPSLSTLANAMDVGNPSNMERVRALYPTLEGLRRDVRAVSVSDDEIRAAIAAGPSRWKRIWCPHTATAAHVRAGLRDGHWIMVATAHPAKFESIVEPLVGREVEVPPPLKAILSRTPEFTEIDPELPALETQLKH